MAKTENSTSTTRRAILAGAAAAIVAVPSPAGADNHDNEVNAVLDAWRAWRALEEEDRRLQADIKWKELGVPGWAQVPSVQVFDKDCWSDDAIDAACNAAPKWLQSMVPEIRQKAHEELIAVWKRRDAFYAKIGLDKLEERSDEITNLQSPLIRTIERSDSSAPIVVAAKLDLAIARFKSDAHLADLPQGHICDAVRGLLPELPADMREKLAPIAAADDVVKSVYWPRPVDMPKPTAAA
jgi:hypothetical protein